MLQIRELYHRPLLHHLVSVVFGIIGLCEMVWSVQSFEVCNCLQKQKQSISFLTCHYNFHSFQHVENLRCHPSVVLPCMIPAMEAGPQVINEVLIAVKRLLTTSGKNLQQLSWHCVLHLLKQALKFCKDVSVVPNWKLPNWKILPCKVPELGKLKFVHRVESWTTFGIPNF